MKQQYEEIEVNFIAVEAADVFTLSFISSGSGNTFDWGDLGFND